jgi:hypothetical protein
LEKKRMRMITTKRMSIRPMSKYESVDTLTSSEFLRAAAVEGDEPASGRTPFKCDGLKDPPKPDEISDVHSPVLGDVYHAMNRPNVATKHDAKKGYYFLLFTKRSTMDHQLLNKVYPNPNIGVGPQSLSI